MIEHREYKETMEEKRASQFVRFLGLSVGLRDLKRNIAKRDLRLSPIDSSYLNLAQDLITHSMQSVLMDISEAHVESEMVLAYDSIANIDKLPPQYIYENQVYSFIMENVADDEKRGLK